MLSHKVIEAIDKHLVDGDRLLDTQKPGQALKLYQEAVSLIPEPKFDHEIALFVFLAVGEAFFWLQRYSDALGAFRQALKCPGGVEEALVHLRLGEAHYELGNKELAGDELTRAYMLGNTAIFEDEDPRYFAFLSTLIDLR